MRTKDSFDWTLERRRKLRTLHEEGLGWEEIAIGLGGHGLTRSAVQGAIQRYGGERVCSKRTALEEHCASNVAPEPPKSERFWTDEKVAELKQLYGKGMSYSEIARVLGTPSRSAVGAKLDRLKLKIGSPSAPPAAAREKRASAPREATPAHRPAPAAPPVGAVNPDAAFRPQASTAPGGGCTLHALARGCCRWPISPPQVYGADILFCAGPQEEGSPYCTEHRRKSGAKMRTPAEQAADRARTEAAKQRFLKTGRLPKRETQPERRRA